MTLDKFPFNELVKSLSNLHFFRNEHFSIEKLLLFKERIKFELKSKFSNKEKHELLVNEIEDIIKNLEFNKLSGQTTLEELKFTYSKQIESFLKKMDLSNMEFSNQSDLDVIQDCIDKYLFLNDKLALLKNNLSKSEPENYEAIIKRFSKNQLVKNMEWEEIGKRFLSGLYDEADNLAIDTIINSSKNNYSNNESKLLEILPQSLEIRRTVHLEKNPDPEEEYLIELERTENKIPKYVTLAKHIKSVINDNEDTIKELEEIKLKYDENAEDVNYDRLLRKILKENNNFFRDNSYELIAKRNLLYTLMADIKEGMDLFYENYSHKPEVENLAFFSDNVHKSRIQLTECYEILNGNFIKESNPKIFISLFEKNRFIRYVNWLGKNKELNYFISNIDDKFRKESYWQEASNCFYRNDKRIPSESIRNHKTSKILNENSKTILDMAIQSLIS